MFQSLSQGVKISITRSIKTAFEQYMNNINWDDQKFNSDDFVRHWRDYSKENATWFEKIDEKMRLDSSFHQELTEKINETIEKIFKAPPTEKQMNEIDSLIKELEINDIDYCCSMEADYQINLLKEELKKKQ